jgi:hypothetical protein
MNDLRAALPALGGNEGKDQQFISHYQLLDWEQVLGLTALLRSCSFTNGLQSGGGRAERPLQPVVRVTFCSAATACQKSMTL